MMLQLEESMDIISWIYMLHEWMTKSAIFFNLLESALVTK